ncbi:MAG: DUF5399 family protein [Chlamydiales bacterium]
MVKIYNYDIHAHERFARDQEEVEAFYKQYHLPISQSYLVAKQTSILDLIPKLSAIVRLMETYRKKTWAGFNIPENYYSQRLAASPYLAPSLGTPEKQIADINKIRTFLNTQAESRLSNKQKETQTSQDVLNQEGEAIIHMIEGIKQVNDMINFVITRMCQFVQA